MPPRQIPRPKSPPPTRRKTNNEALTTARFAVERTIQQRALAGRDRTTFSCGIILTTSFSEQLDLEPGEEGE
ncbi:MAG: hypothetical protein ABI995_16705 [Acidobacteriota bacterium]